MPPNSRLAAPSWVKNKSTALLFTPLVIFILILSACGGGSTQSNQAGAKHILKIATQSYDFAQSGFNPYNGHTNAGVAGLVYQTPYFVNVNDGSFSPMLAPSDQWNRHKQQ